MTTIFQKIIGGELPAAKLYEDDKHIAILDLFPMTPGHTLVIPKQPEPYLFDLSGDDYRKLMELSRELAIHLKQQLSCERVCMAVLGWEIPHVHVHLIPTNSIQEFPFPSREKAANEELEEMCRKLAFSR